MVFLSFGKENNAENTKKQQELTPEILPASEWQEDVYGCFLTMCDVKFTMDMTFTGFFPNAESDGDFSGTYKIENGRLTLSDGFDCTNGVLVNDASLRYTQRIEFDDSRVLHNTKSKNIDRKQQLNNISIITIGMKEARTSTNLKFREIPDMEGK